MTQSVSFGSSYTAYTGSLHTKTQKDAYKQLLTNLDNWGIDYITKKETILAKKHHGEDTINTAEKTYFQVPNFADTTIDTLSEGLGIDITKKPLFDRQA